MQVSCKIIDKHGTKPDNLIFPPFPLAHGEVITEIITGQEPLTGSDGIWTQNKDFILGISSADCGMIYFKNSRKFGVIHAGWRGICGNICETMMRMFEDDKEPFEVFVGPLLNTFEIEKDFCYSKIRGKFGGKYFSPGALPHKINFDFMSALQSILPDHARFDGRDTLSSPELWSWRENNTPHRNFMIAGVFNDQPSFLLIKKERI